MKLALRKISNQMIAFCSAQALRANAVCVAFGSLFLPRFLRLFSFPYAASSLLSSSVFKEQSMFILDKGFIWKNRLR